MEHAIDNKEIGFIVFSKLTSQLATIGHNTFAYQLQKKVVQSRHFPHRSALFLIYLPPALSRFALDLSACCFDSLAVRKVAQSTHEREVELTIWAHLPSSKADRDVGPLPSNLELLCCDVSFAPTNTHDRPKPRTILARQLYLPGSGPQPAPRSQLKKQAAV